MIEIKPLPWNEDALEKVISTRTIQHHYHKHHKGYVDKLNAALGSTECSLEEIILKFKDNKSIYNNAAQHYNHEFYWESLTPAKNQPSEQLAGLIEKNFGGMQKLLEALQLACTSLFGSGWVWLTINGDKLEIEQTSNADLPVYKPLITIDVWEHAYYLDYQQKRPNYIKGVLDLLDWERASMRLMVSNAMYGY